VITKSPSQCDGKPVGAPTDAKTPWQAGVTMGLDQIERDEANRRARNRTVKLSERAKLKAQRKVHWESQQAGDKQWWEYKQRRKRAMEMWRSIHNHGRSIAWCAKARNITPEQALQEIQWWDKRRERRRKRG
jgi:hypothetical protein